MKINTWELSKILKVNSRIINGGVCAKSYDQKSCYATAFRNQPLLGKKEAFWPPDVEDISNPHADMVLTEINAWEGDVMYLDFVIYVIQESWAELPLSFVFQDLIIISNCCVRAYFGRTF